MDTFSTMFKSDKSGKSDNKSSSSSSDINFSTFSKKMSSISDSISSLSISKEDEKKAAKAIQMAVIMTLLEDVRLLCPQTHIGLVLAYATATLSPINNPGIKFTWHRMNRDSNHFYQVDESYRAWYTPTYDDIGSKICVQCEDVFGEGFSRYLETGYIDVDPVLCSVVEDIVTEKQHYEIHDTAITFGIEEREFNADEKSTTIIQSEVKYRPSSLKPGSNFFSLNGRSSVEVDIDGIFISLPIPKRDSYSQTSSNNSSNSMNKNKYEAKKVRRGFHIPSNESLTVQCTQPASLVISIQLRRGHMNDDGGTSSSYDSSIDTTNDAISPLSTDSSIEKDINQSNPLEILPIIPPWSYIRNITSSENSPRKGQTSVDIDLQIAEEEHEASTFGSSLTSIEMFLAGLDVSVTTVKICVSCGDRMQRDTLAACITALSCQKLGIATTQRLNCFPWRSPITGEKIYMGKVSESSLEMGKRLVELEEENKKLRIVKDKDNISIKKNKLSLTLLEIEDGVIKNSSNDKIDYNIADDNNDLHNINSNHINEQEEEKEEEEEEEENNNNNRVKLLSQKVIDLENKLALVSRRELEFSHNRHQEDIKNTKILNETEARNEILIAELSTSRKNVAETNKKLYDLEDQYKILNSHNDKLNINFKKIEKELELTISSNTMDVARLNNLYDKLLKDYDNLHTNKIENDQINSKKIIELEESLKNSITINKEINSEILSLKTLCNEQSIHVIHMDKIELELKEVNSNYELLLGENNHAKRKAETQTKELKKILLENSQTTSEYAKALMSKIDECNEIEGRYQQLLQENEILKSQVEVKKGKNLMSRLSFKKNNNDNNDNNINQIDNDDTNNEISNSSTSPLDIVKNKAAGMKSKAGDFAKRLSFSIPTRNSNEIDVNNNEIYFNNNEIDLNNEIDINNEINGLENNMNVK